LLQYYTDLILLSETGIEKGYNLLQELNNYLRLKYKVDKIEEQVLLDDTLTIAYVNGNNCKFNDLKHILYNYPKWKKKII